MSKDVYIMDEIHAFKDNPAVEPLELEQQRCPKCFLLEIHTEHTWIPERLSVTYGDSLLMCPGYKRKKNPSRAKRAARYTQRK